MNERALNGTGRMCFAVFIASTIVLQAERDAQLSNIDVVILVPDDKFKTLKPSDTITYDDCVLVNKDNMSKISEQINEYEAETVSELANQK